MARPIPPRPNLEFDRKQARALLESIRRGDADAVGRLRAQHPRYAGDRAVEGVILADALLVVAREYGFESWPRWKRHVELTALEAPARADALARAACSRDLRTARALLEREPALARQSLAAACACGDVEEARRRLDVEPSLANALLPPLDRPPILYATTSRLGRTDPAIMAGLRGVVALLISRGADLDVVRDEPQGDGRMTALYGAAGILNDDAMTSLLLRAGADVNEGDREPDPADPAIAPWGPEALYHAAEWRDAACLRLLLQAGPRPLYVSYCLGRAIDFDHTEGVRAFLQHGADPDFRVPWMRRRSHLQKAVGSCAAETIALLLERGGDINATDDDGLSAYRMGVRRGDPAIVALLRQAGGDDAALTPLDRRLGQAARGAPPAPEAVGDFDPGGDDAVRELALAVQADDAERARRLLDAGVRPDPRDPARLFPPLHEACFRGRAALARLLLERGARTDLVDAYGADALGCCVYGSLHCADPRGGGSMRSVDELDRSVYAEIARRLLEAGAAVPATAGGHPLVRDVLLRHGAVEPDEPDEPTA